MDGIAAFTGLFGMVIGAAAFHHAMKRHWWALTSVLSIGAAGMLLMATEKGPRSHDERTAVSATYLGLLAACVIAAIIQRRQARRAGAATRRS